MREQQETGFTVDELQALTKLKDRLRDLDIEKNVLFEDRRLINWLIARDFKINDAETMLRNHLKWRKEYEIDTLLTSGIIPPSQQADVPCEVVGEDNDGNFIIGVYVGGVDVKGLVRKYDKIRAILGIFHFLESYYQLLIRKSGDSIRLKKIRCVFDCEGARIKDFLSAEVIDVLTTILAWVESNYPELLLQATIINAPFVFPILWNIVKPFLGVRTVGKVEILRYNQEKQKDLFLENIPESQFPRKWGGTGVSKKFPTLNVFTTQDNSDCELEFQEVKIPPGQYYDVVVDVTVPRTLLSWNFKTKHYDIGFTVLCTKVEDEDLDLSAVGYKRINSSKGTHFGAIVCDSCGKYTLRFDNSYSRFREKCLLYRVEMSGLATNGNNDDEVNKALRSGLIVG